MGFLEKLFNLVNDNDKEGIESDNLEQEIQGLSAGKERKSYSTCVVDFANFLGCDFTNVFEKASYICNNENADIVIVVNSKRKDFFEKLDVLSHVFKRFGVSVYFAVGETDIEILRFVSKKINQGNNVLFMSSDYGLIETIANSFTPNQVSFFVDAKNSPSLIENIKRKGYEIYFGNILTKKEGVIKRVLKMRAQEVRMARGYTLKKPLEDYLIGLLPMSLSSLMQTAIKSGHFKDGLSVKMALASLCLKNEIDFAVKYGNTNPNNVIVRFSLKKHNNINDNSIDNLEEEQNNSNSLGLQKEIKAMSVVYSGNAFN